MIKQVRTLAEAAAKLPAAERITLVEEILASIAEDDAAWSRAWSEEAARRMADFEAGQASADDSEQVFARLRAKYQ